MNIPRIYRHKNEDFRVQFDGKSQITIDGGSDTGIVEILPEKCTFTTVVNNASSSSNRLEDSVSACCNLIQKARVPKPTKEELLEKMQEFFESLPKDEDPKNGTQS